MKKLLLFGMIFIYYFSGGQDILQPKEDCDFYLFVKQNKLETVWDGNQEASSEKLFLKICNLNYEIMFGCSCNSDAIGATLWRNGSLLPEDKLRDIEKNIELSFLNKTLTKETEPDGKVRYIIFCP